MQKMKNVQHVMAQAIEKMQSILDHQLWQIRVKDLDLQELDRQKKLWKQIKTNQCLYRQVYVDIWIMLFCIFCLFCFFFELLIISPYFENLQQKQLNKNNSHYPFVFNFQSHFENFINSLM